jgi:hypothetical protein
LTNFLLQVEGTHAAATSLFSQQQQASSKLTTNYIYSYRDPVYLTKVILINAGGLKTTTEVEDDKSVGERVVFRTFI